MSVVDYFPDESTINYPEGKTFGDLQKKLPKKKITQEKDHAKLSASGSSMWFNCAGSIQAQSEFEDTSSEYAEEGTLAHELGDTCLKSGKDAAEFIGKEIKAKSNGKIISCIVTEEMAKFVQEYVDYVLSHENNDTQLFTEDKVDFSNVVPDGFGTMDSAVLDYKTGMCHIFDLKYGMVKVEAENNSQGLLYATGLYNELKFLEVIKAFTIHIVQPRAYNYSSFEVSLEDLEKFGELAKFKAQEALKPNAKRTPGEKQCRFCKANGNCPAIYEMMIETIGEEFEDLDSSELSNERLAEILDKKDQIEKFLKNVSTFVYNMLLEGKKLAGYKLVQTKSNRKWLGDAEEKLKEMLGDKAYEKPALIGITAAEKILKKAEVDKLTWKPEGGIVLAQANDKRPEIKAQSLDEFDNLDEDNL